MDHLAGVEDPHHEGAMDLEEAMAAQEVNHRMAMLVGEAMLVMGEVLFMAVDGEDFLEEPLLQLQQQKWQLVNAGEEVIEGRHQFIQCNLPTCLQGNKV